MSTRAKTLRSRLFEGIPEDWEAYHQAIVPLLQAGGDVIEIGCGKGNIHPFAWGAYPECTLVGMDPDPEAAVNPFLSAFRHLDLVSDWPMEEDSADLVLARFVLEHVEDPAHFMRNLRRVLRPGGKFVFLTPSIWNPFFRAAHFVPHNTTQRILAWTKGATENDVFPAFYRMNSKRRLRSLAVEHGFEVSKLLQTDFQPISYFDFALPLFFCNLGWYYATKLARMDRNIGASILGEFSLNA